MWTLRHRFIGDPAILHHIVSHIKAMKVAFSILNMLNDQDLTTQQSTHTILIDHSSRLLGGENVVNYEIIV